MMKNDYKHLYIAQIKYKKIRDGTYACFIVCNFKIR